MNNNRRYRIGKLIETLAGTKTELEILLHEEQAAFDSLPEPLQDSEMGDEMQDAIENMEEASSSLEEVISYLEEAKN